jgi:4-hydroxy-tetrahydrodipicolinate reductase
MINIGIAGAAGKMGRALVRAVAKEPKLKLAAAWDKPGHELLGQDIGVIAGTEVQNIKLQEVKDDLLKACQLLVDFTAPLATLQLVERAVALQRGMIIGTTGLNEGQMEQIKQAGRTIPIMYATNYSVGMNLLWALARQAATVLGEGYDAEIIESHHNQKKDSPSGSALTLLEAICQGKGLDPKTAVRHGRQGIVGARSKTEVGMHAVRAGDIVGDHTALFSGTGERLELKHQAHSRDVLAQGAVRAAAWLTGKKPGVYSMADVLGLSI